LAEFKNNPRAARLKDYKNFSMYPKFNYPGHRWGMNIDLNKCTGCSACVVACQSENNVPVVGKEEVALGRHMGWMRMDLYHKGDQENPDSSDFQPMLCQQCEMAPCETVCPVLATVHSSDGLNDMVYNRCVGTRYCANNCPYKVRRFNYFQYSDALAGKQEVRSDSPLAMILNPDVTVRTRGVMEKCTFCVQRIRRGVDDSKAKGEKLVDGAIKTACQQSCPADAISFGDLNDEASDVSVQAKKAQAFKVLDVLNTNPSVSYMPRVRNKGMA
jgi:molybdopterin-containing oxidoreductase family iron-sulfur binding subunit